MRNRYRIVTDRYLGFEVQVKFWFFPLCWLQCTSNNGITNTSCKLATAEALMESKARGTYKGGMRTVVSEYSYEDAKEE